MGCCTSKSSKARGRNAAETPDQEKHHSANSTTPLTSTPRTFRSRSDTIQTCSSFPESPVQIDDTGGHSNVTRPPPPPRLHRLSELIDPADLDPMGAVIRSPSGNLLAAEAFLQHPDRPLSLRERQEIIRARVRAVSRLGMVEDVKGVEEMPPGHQKRTTAYSCFRGHE